ncbi:MAG: hypothetical protein RLP02_13340 [Coleofasciculus sp. C2-GNP5-27]
MNLINDHDKERGEYLSPITGGSGTKLPRPIHWLAKQSKISEWQAIAHSDLDNRHTQSVM